MGHRSSDFTESGLGRCHGWYWQIWGSGGESEVSDSELLGGQYSPEISYWLVNIFKNLVWNKLFLPQVAQETYLTKSHKNLAQVMSFSLCVHNHRLKYPTEKQQVFWKWKYFIYIATELMADDFMKLFPVLLYLKKNLFFDEGWLYLLIVDSSGWISWG